MILVFVLFLFGTILFFFYKPFAFPKTVEELNFREILLKSQGITHGTIY